MRSDGITPSPGFGKRNDQVATLELSGKGRPVFLEFPAIQTNELSTKSVSVVDRPALTSLPLKADHDRLTQELACLGQTGWAAYQRSQYLLAVVRPFLSRTTWTEAIGVARCGGCALPTETREASILWLDIANFTALTDSHPLDQVLLDLNTYLDTMTQLVYSYQGDVNKYLGDGLLGVFADADDAVKAGCAIQRAAADFNGCQSAGDGMVFPTRVGVASGQIAVVSLGSRDRQDRTVIGVPVNLAKRLQEKATPGRVWLLQATFDQLRDQSGCRYLGPVRIKGRQKDVIVYEKQCRP